MAMRRHGPDGLHQRRDAADWAANRDELMAFWRSGKTTADVFPDTLPWLYVGGSADTLPWAAVQLAS
jgi:hypothetical protein